MPIYWLTGSLTFPNPRFSSSDGIVAVGGDLSVERLLLAYGQGIFPWFNPEDPIIWWCPDPRYVLFPDELKVSKSMRPIFNQGLFQVSFDTDFEGVIHGCQTTPRPGQDGDTWLTPAMREAYTELHRMGYAHSVEVRQGGELVGGLYGVSLGRCFFGESMFARASNASKVGFITLVRALEARGFWVIDCQQGTRHLISLGARGIPRDRFLDLLVRNQREETLRGPWTDWLPPAQ